MRRGTAHILCEKPLALNAPAARALLDAVERAGVRHAYAASYRYDPSVAWLRELVAAGQIGPLREIAYASRYPAPEPGVWAWRTSWAC
jgi:predicted dehydrogenase